MVQLRPRIDLEEAEGDEGLDAVEAEVEVEGDMDVDEEAEGKGGNEWRGHVISNDTPYLLLAEYPY